MITLQSNESYELEKKQINLLLSKRVDGILISLANETGDYKHLTEIIENDTPLVMFDKIAKIVNCSKVIINDRKAAYTATKYLIDSGCKRIAHFRGPLLPQNSIDRFLGYKTALDDNGIAYDSSLVYVLKDMSFDEGVHFSKKLLEAKHRDERRKKHRDRKRFGRGSIKSAHRDSRDIEFGILIGRLEADRWEGIHEGGGRHRLQEGQAQRGEDYPI